MSNEQQRKCLACERGSDATPLIHLEYRGEDLWICPQHLPVLIHDPSQLVGAARRRRTPASRRASRLMLMRPRTKKGPVTCQTVWQT